ncbi:Rho termination factor N-terminal domain-containing protein [Phascolarctobacterium succinatutens]|uniref:Rho termination factor N-terminal domain-containing protein n=1 Tax=Phascolarctobacterium succinatutens TaxID=626940 RepID=UPI0027B94C55|nr:Rho termination factor N-terminal domain-containing protein [Phascolarctobacterium succinatutens]
MRYKVIRTCYWQRRLWEKGEVVELGENVPEHFKPLYNPAERLALNKNADELSDEEPSDETPSNEVLSDEEPMNEEPSDETSGSMENPDIMPSSLEDMNVGQLQKLARANGLEPPKNAKKQELISALRGE